MNAKQKKDMYSFYRKTLLTDCISFWENNCLDKEYGGVFTCLDRDGNLYNSDKSVWFQGRALWTFSKLYNDVEPNTKWIKIADSANRFINDHCFDYDGRMFFTVTQDGKELQKRRYFFSEMFAIIGMAEYSKAIGNANIFNKALVIYKRIMDMYLYPAGNLFKINPETRKVKSLSLPMMMLYTTQTIRDIKPSEELDDIAQMLANELINDFLHENEKALYETVRQTGERLDGPQGRCMNPGHAIETSWFIMHEGIYQNNWNLIVKGLEIFEYSFKHGWDEQHGGLFYFVDIEGKPAEQIEWDMKLWWPHTEALYASLLAYTLTNDERFLRYYDMIHEWTFRHFPDNEKGEWFGYLHRDGSVSNTLKGSIWKGPFHLPRALYQCMKLCESSTIEA